MGIVTQASLTALRTLKYGNDQPGGGNSNEPYVTRVIPPVDKQQVTSTNIWNSDSGLIRGGFTGATYASSLDTLRIGRFLADPPRGPLFIAKQVGLQLSNPQLETTGFAAVGPTRVYNLGINTLAQIPVNAFGGHIVRHGFSPFLNEGQTYAKVVVAKNLAGNNRLVRLKDKLQQYPNANIAQYVGGPGSVDGIGTTTIRRYNNTLSNPTYNQYANIVLNRNNPAVSVTNLSILYPRYLPNIDYFLAQGVSEQYFAGDRIKIEQLNNIVTGSFDSPPSQIDQSVINYPATGRTYKSLINAVSASTTDNRIGTANIIKAGSNVGDGTINNNNNVIRPITFTYTGKSKYKSLDLAKFNIETRTGAGSTFDSINTTPLFNSDTPPGTSVTVNGIEYNVRDLIKFRIEAVNGDNSNFSTWMVFRALVTDISDNPNPSWNTVNYVGRGEPFYIYKGFERNVSFTFKVAAMSESEMEPIWQKLNYLYSNTMPDYSGLNNSIMRGPYMKLTMGNYMYRQPGIIKSLTYSIDNNVPWEIAIDDPEVAGGSLMYELPHVMTVNMTYAPIHDFLPRKFPQKYSGGNSWANLPAFVTDRTDNQNKWLSDIFNASNEIPTSN